MRPRYKLMLLLPQVPDVKALLNGLAFHGIEVDTMEAGGYFAME